MRSSAYLNYTPAIHRLVIFLFASQLFGAKCVISQPIIGHLSFLLYYSGRLNDCYLLPSYPSPNYPSPSYPSPSCYSSPNSRKIRLSSHNLIFISQPSICSTRTLLQSAQFVVQLSVNYPFFSTSYSRIVRPTLCSTEGMLPSSLMTNF